MIYEIPIQIYLLFTINDNNKKNIIFVAEEANFLFEILQDTRRIICNIESERENFGIYIFQNKSQAL